MAGERGRVVVDRLGQDRAPRRRCRRAPPRRRSAAPRAPRSAGRAGRCGGPRAGRCATVSRAPRSLPRRARPGSPRAPRAIASPCWAAPSRASGSRPPRRARGCAAAISAASCSGDLEPAGQLARIEVQGGQRGPVRAPALHGVGDGRPERRRGRRTHRAGRAASARRGAAAGRAGRGSRRAARPTSARRAAVTGLVVEAGRRAAAGGHLADGDQRLRDGVEQRLDRARSRRRAGRGSCPRAPPIASPSASMSRLLPAPVSPVSTLRPGSSSSRSALDQGEVADRQLDQASGARRRPAARPARGPRRGSGSRRQQLHLAADRSQNGSARAARRGGSAAPAPGPRRRRRRASATSSRPSMLSDRLGRVDDPAADDLVRADDDRADRRRGSRRSGSRSGSGSSGSTIGPPALNE